MARKKAASKQTRSKTTVKKNARKSSKRVKARRSPAPRPAALKLDETPAARKRRATRILKALRAAHPDADCALHHRNAYELLVATILSAQCTDERVNQITPELFRRYPDAQALAHAKQETLETQIRSTGFFRNKARNLIGMAQAVCERFDGRIPDNMDDLLQLPGVARKTANCVLGTWYRKNVGLVVDTHVGRLAQRLGLLATARNDKDAVRIEQDLMKLFPTESWTWLSHALILHGRQVCTARKPRCDECPLARDCPSAGAFD